MAESAWIYDMSIVIKFSLCPYFIYQIQVIRNKYAISSKIIASDLFANLLELSTRLIN